jgi:two-component system, LuxR family, response regulator FixJ
LSAEKGERTERMTAEERIAPEIVCLVDDDHAVLKSVARLLESDGLVACAFSEPEQFLAYVATHSVPVAILDIWMEQMTGLEVQAKLAKISPSTRVIIMTGRKDPGAQKTALEFGAAAFFTKPFDDEEFLGAIRDALTSRTES